MPEFDVKRGDNQSNDAYKCSIELYIHRSIADFSRANPSRWQYYIVMTKFIFS